MTLAPVLEREEYVEQAYCFRVFRERLMEGLASQEVLSQLHAEVLSTTRLPYAIQFLATELKHTGLLSPGFERLSHYFTPYQAFVARQTEREKMRFSLETALQVARQQDAHGLELRAAVGLSRCWYRLRRGADARRLLEEVAGRFTEGAETADLKAAQALLTGR